jgi:hypothetical protein
MNVGKVFRTIESKVPGGGSGEDLALHFEIIILKFEGF